MEPENMQFYELPGDSKLEAQGAHFEKHRVGRSFVGQCGRHLTEL